MAAVLLLAPPHWLVTGRQLPKGVGGHSADSNPSPGFITSVSILWHVIDVKIPVVSITCISCVAGHHRTSVTDLTFPS